MSKVAAYAAQSAHSPMAPHTIERRSPGPKDVVIDILYCGICHSDLHAARGDWGPVPYPLVPGHEIVGRVVSTGAEANKYKPGDLVGVGCLVDSCRTCEPCREGEEQFCNSASATYLGMEKETGRPTNGGYSKSIVVTEHFVVRIPEALDPAAAAPLLCAGITTYSPLRTWKVGPGQRVGVVGLGGLGHMAVKLAHAMGAHVTAFTTSESKRADALALGADEVVLSTDEAAMAKCADSLHFILDTAAASHDLDAYLRLLRRDGVLTLVGAPSHPHPSPSVMTLLARRRRIAGSPIGGLVETQEMLEFCAEKGVAADIEIIPMESVNQAYDRIEKGDVRYRFVIDMATLR